MRIVEAHQQVDQRRLAGPGVADDRQPLARLGRERHTLQDPLRRFSVVLVARLVIGEPDVAELDGPLGRGGQGARTRRVGHRRLHVDQLEDALGAGHGALQDVELLGQVLNRTIEPAHVLEKRGDDAHGQRALQHVQSAVPEDERHGDGGHQLDDRPEQRVVSDRSQVGLQVFGVDLLELAELGALAAEELDHAHAGDPLLQKRVDPGEPHADVAIRAAHVLAKPVGGEPDGRQHQERDERQLPAHEQHHAYNKDQGEDVPEHGHDAGRE